MASTSTGQSIANIEQRHRRIRLANLTKLIDVELDLLHESFQEAKRRIDPVIAQINQARHKFEGILQQGEGVEMTELAVERELQDLKQETSKLKSKIPFSLITPEYQPATDPNVIFQPPTHPPKPSSSNRQLNLNGFFYFFNALCDSPDLPESIILRCFLAFPEGAFIKTSLLCSYANGVSSFFISSESVVRKACKLVSEAFIKSVYKKHSGTNVDGFWMEPSFHRILKYRISSELSEVQLLCHVNSSSINGEDIIYSVSADASILSSKLRFLHLGKWQRYPTHHNIEMPDPNLYFKHAGDLRDLMYISFREVSVMKELPSFITHLCESNGTMKEAKLKYLRILDLKACHHLEVIPSDIGNLWCSLTHLDMSECYFLDHMPTSLSRLILLRVLKGFFVGEINNEEECCTLQDLSSLRWLMKLHIYTSLKTFPSADHLTILQGFKDLRNLTICWGACPNRDDDRELRPRIIRGIRPKRLVTRALYPVVRVNMQFLFHLEKLDLRGAPEKGTHNWLMPSNFEKLEKLYIRGGQLSHLKHNNEKGWSVKVLRLRHLSKLEMDWSELQNSFPNMVSLEKVECPILTSFPCDGDGLWTKENPEFLDQYYMIDGR